MLDFEKRKFRGTRSSNKRLLMSSLLVPIELLYQEMEIEEVSWSGVTHAITLLPYGELAHHAPLHSQKSDRLTFKMDHKVIPLPFQVKITCIK